MLTILVGDVTTEPPEAAAGQSASPASWSPLDLFDSWRSFLCGWTSPGSRRVSWTLPSLGGASVSGARYLAAGPDGERFYRLERPAGSFRRSVGLPAAATLEMVDASVEDGVLTVVVPISHQQPGVG